MRGVSLIVAAGVAAAAAAAPAVAPWTHAWDTAGDGMWVDFAGAAHRTLPSKAQTEFIAAHYAVVSLEKCFATAAGTNEGVVGGYAAALRAANPALRVLYYFNSEYDFSDCYDAGAVFNARPGWWLRDDSGAPYGSPGQRTHDVTQAAVRAYITAALVNASGAARAAGGALSGVFFDRMFPKPFPDMSPQRNAAAAAGKFAAADEARAALHDAASGFTPDARLLGNVFNLYTSVDPGHGTESLPHVDGGCFEHWGGFEMLDATTGKLDPALYEVGRQLVVNATRAGQNVFIRGWPGPATQPITALGPSWPGGRQPQDRAGLAAAAAEWFVPALASYLVVAENTTFFSYSWWYTVDDGVTPCPEAPGTCSAPAGWYPELSKPLGPPAGPAARVPGGSGWRYARSFAHADVVYDAGDVKASTITWR
jgi:hypothetical protein